MTSKLRSSPSLALELVLRDARWALGSLVRHRGFSVTAVLTLGITLGLAMTAFGAFDAVVRRPLPFPEADRLTVLYKSYPGAGIPRAPNSVADYYDRREGVPALQELAVFRRQDRTLITGGVPERVGVGEATSTLFDLVGTQLLRGRIFSPDEERVAVLSYGLWRRLYGERVDTVGAIVRLDGKPYTIVGILPPGFDLPSFDADLWVPATFDPADRAPGRRHSNSWQMLGRLAPGATVALAQTQLDNLTERNLERYPEERQLLIDARFGAVVADYKSDLVREIAPKLSLLLVGTLFVLLIGCVNVANLVLVRSSVRGREVATRLALGASRERLAWQLFSEHALLAFAGCGLGWLVGWGGLRLLHVYVADRLPRGAEIALDWRIGILALAAALAVGLVFGLLAVGQALGRTVSSVLRVDVRAASPGRRALRGRHVLVGVQVALACALLVTSGFLLVSFVELASVDPGFETEGVWTGSLAFPPGSYEEPSAKRALVTRFLDRVRSAPGVVAAGLTSNLPFGVSPEASGITVEGRAPDPGESVRAPNSQVVTPGYFEALAIPLLDGRMIDERDTAESQPVVVIDEWVADAYWPEGGAVGGRLYEGVPGAEQPEWKTVIGVVAEVRQDDLAGSTIPGACYYPYTQESRDVYTLAVRTTAADPFSLTGSLRRYLAELDPELPLYDVRTLEDRVAKSLGASRLATLLVVFFSQVALFLAAVGTYGVLSYAVAQRSRELGIRMALGSSPRELSWLVLRQAAGILALGLTLGSIGGLLLTHAMRGLLFGLEFHDPTVFLGVAGVLAAVTLLAAWLPARRAAKVDPVVVLASE